MALPHAPASALVTDLPQLFNARGTLLDGVRDRNRVAGQANAAIQTEIRSTALPQDAEIPPCGAPGCQPGAPPAFSGEPRLTTACSPGQSWGDATFVSEHRHIPDYPVSGLPCAFRDVLASRRRFSRPAGAGSFFNPQPRPTPPSLPAIGQHRGAHDLALHAWRDGLDVLSAPHAANRQAPAQPAIRRRTTAKAKRPLPTQRLLVLPGNHVRRRAVFAPARPMFASSSPPKVRPCPMPLRLKRSRRP